MLESSEINSRCFYCKGILNDEKFAHDECFCLVYKEEQKIGPYIYDKTKYMIKRGNKEHPNRLWYRFEGYTVNFYAYSTLIGIYYQRQLFLIENVFSFTTRELIIDIATLMGKVRNESVYDYWNFDYYERKYQNVFELPYHAFVMKINTLDINESIYSVDERYWYEFINSNLLDRNSSNRISEWKLNRAAMFNREIDEPTPFRRHIHIIRSYFDVVTNFYNRVVYLDYNKTRAIIKIWSNQDNKYEKQYEIKSIKAFNEIKGELNAMFEVN